MCKLKVLYFFGSKMKNKTNFKKYFLSFYLKVIQIHLKEFLDLRSLYGPVLDFGFEVLVDLGRYKFA
jgi:hypothetical protein